MRSATSISRFLATGGLFLVPRHYPEVERVFLAFPGLFALARIGDFTRGPGALQFGIVRNDSRAGLELRKLRENLGRASRGNMQQDNRGVFEIDIGKGRLLNGNE